MRPISGARGVEDGGLQPERTRLAWSRTALSLGAVGGLVVHPGDSLFAVVAGLTLILLALVTYGVGVARYRGLARAASAARPVAAPRALRVVGVCAVLATPATLLVLFV